MISHLALGCDIQNFTSTREKYFALYSLEKISLNMGPLRAGLMSAWFSLTGSRHNLTFPLGFSTNLKLFHCSAVSSTPSDCYDVLLLE